jgi:hypothetical protein
MAFITAAKGGTGPVIIIAIVVVSFQQGLHARRWHHRERAVHRVVEIEVWAVEEHPGMAGAVRTESAVSHCPLAQRWLEQPEQVEVVTRHALATVAQLPAAVVPSAEPMQDHDFVPERSLRLHRRDTGHLQVDTRHVVSGVRLHGGHDVRVKGRLGPGFDLDG